MKENFFFMVTHKWARDLEKEIMMVIPTIELNVYGSADQICAECVRHEIDRYRASKRIQTGVLSKSHIYSLIAAKAYSKVLYAPFKCFSALHYTVIADYKKIFTFAFSKLVEIGIYSEKDMARAMSQLNEVEALCDRLRAEDLFMEW
jgi:hypothetical protein